MKAARVIAKPEMQQPMPLSSQAVRYIASSIYKHLQSEGCEMRDIISVSTHLLSLAATDLEAKEDPSAID